MYPICYQQVSGGYLQPEPTMYSRCFHWFPGPSPPVGEGHWKSSSTGSSGQVRDGLFWGLCSQVDCVAVQQPMSGIGRLVYYYQSNCVLVVLSWVWWDIRRISIRKEIINGKEGEEVGSKWTRKLRVKLVSDDKRKWKEHDKIGSEKVQKGQVKSKLYINDKTMTPGSWQFP